MPIAFEDVSYSYSAPTKRRKKSKDGKGSWHTRKDGTGSTADGQSPAWGNAPDAVWALRHIDLVIEDGEFLGIAGHTGSGKSTLIQHMNGLINPTEGRVVVDGQDLAIKQAAAHVRNNVGLVFQYPEHQLFAATVYEDVAFGPNNLGLQQEEVEERVRTSLYQVALDFEDIKDKSPFELSGGQQRRVAFAGVLAMRPTKLILDEPVAGLDPATRMDFLNLIDDLHEGGLTVVMVSHSMNNLAHFCDRILVLKEGEQFALGTPSEVFTRGEELKAIGLGVPSAQRLASRLKEEGIALGEGMFNTERLVNEIASLYKGMH